MLLILQILHILETQELPVVCVSLHALAQP